MGHDLFADEQKASEMISKEKPIATGPAAALYFHSSSRQRNIELSLSKYNQTQDTSIEKENLVFTNKMGTHKFLIKYDSTTRIQESNDLHDKTIQLGVIIQPIPTHVMSLTVGQAIKSDTTYNRLYEMAWTNYSFSPLYFEPAISYKSYPEEITKNYSFTVGSYISLFHIMARYQTTNEEDYFDWQLSLKGQAYFNNYIIDMWYARGNSESSRGYLLKDSSSEFETYGTKVKYALWNDLSLTMGVEKRVESYFNEIGYQVGGNVTF